MSTLSATIARGLDASRPAASEPGRLYFSSDVAACYRDNGTSWDAISVSGPAGSNGTNGHSILNGTGAPSSGTGTDGDFYIDTAAEVIYGPKASGAWPGSGTSLVGPAGPTGATGATGPSGAAPLTTKGDLLGYDTAVNRVAIGADGTVLTADSTQSPGFKWTTRAISASWMMGTGATGTNVGKRLVAPRAGQITSGRIVIDASDGATALTFDIKKNGTSIFSSARTISAGASAGSVTDLTSALSANPTAVAAGDVFTLDITSGSSSWQFTVAMG